MRIRLTLGRLLSFLQIGADQTTVLFLSDPGVPGVRSMGPVVSNSLIPTPFADLTDVTLTKAIRQ